ncbi:MAG: type II secretion system major pseudopilin GspG [Candidatus Omnitrophica bacterium]|nr:type II secretion system major pseudopilin GspG [Candidatus Omnitrophota bacterium]
MKSNKNSVSRKSFTLIELMLVVIIIGVLAAMVMPRLVGRSEQARVAAAKADIDSNLATALDLYEMDIGHYPNALSELRSDSGTAGWKGPYLKKAAKDPWGREYDYNLEAAENKDYKLCSKGADEVKTDDDICN